MCWPGRRARPRPEREVGGAEQDAQGLATVAPQRQQGSGSITRICTAGSCSWNMANRRRRPLQASAVLRDGLRAAGTLAADRSQLTRARRPLAGSGSLSPAHLNGDGEIGREAHFHFLPAATPSRRQTTTTARLRPASGATEPESRLRGLSRWTAGDTVPTLWSLRENRTWNEKPEPATGARRGEWLSRHPRSPYWKDRRARRLLWLVSVWIGQTPTPPSPVLISTFLILPRGWSASIM